MLTVDSFYENARKGKLLGLRCESGHVSVPPRRSCPTCRSAQLEEVELSGRGEVVSFTRVDYKARDFPLDTPYTLVLVRLEEGGNLLGILEKAFSKIDKLAHGSKVSAKFHDAGKTSEKWPRIFFELT